MKHLIVLVAVAFVVGVGGGLFYRKGAEARAPKAFLLSSVSPGKLTPSHAFLSTRCDSCHTPVRGVTDAACTGCHSASERLLSHQPTAFHADIGNCTACHVEHQGRKKLSPPLDHDVLLKVGRRAHGEKPGHQEVGRLDCFGCHSKQDKHQGFFGKDCQSCHVTSSWQIAQYRHPSPDSRACAQCHQAPPSHYMEHFRMVSMKVAGREHAKVNQCYLCHRTTAWNDIEGVGWYKHH